MIMCVALIVARRVLSGPPVHACHSIDVACIKYFKQKPYIKRRAFSSKVNSNGQSIGLYKEDARPKAIGYRPGPAETREQDPRSRDCRAETRSRISSWEMGVAHHDFSNSRSAVKHTRIM